MNDETPPPFEAVGDSPIEARIVAWVLGDASAFEAAELERLCEERPELLVFRRRMRALHGLLTEAEASEADQSWKLPPEKRKLLDEIFGEEKIVCLEQEKEARISRAGLRAFLAIAACLVLAVVLLQLVSPIWITQTVPAAAEKRVDFMPPSGGGGVSAEALNKAVRDQEDKVEERRKTLAAIVRTKGIVYKGQDSFYGQAGVDEDQAAKSSKEYAIGRGLDAQDYVDAKRDFETDQELLQTMRLEQINKTIKGKMPDDAVVIPESPMSGPRATASFRSPGQPAPSKKRNSELAASNAAPAAPSAPEPVSRPVPAEPSARPSESKVAGYPMSLAKSKEGLKESHENLRRGNLAPESHAEVPASEIAGKLNLPQLTDLSSLTPVPEGASLTLSGGLGGGDRSSLNAMQFADGETDLYVGEKSGEAGILHSGIAYQMKADDRLAGQANLSSVFDGIEKTDGFASGLSNGLRSGDQAISRHSIDAILNNPNPTADKKADASAPPMPTLAGKSGVGSLSLRGNLEDRQRKSDLGDDEKFEGSINYGSPIAGASGGSEAKPASATADSPVAGEGMKFGRLAQREVIRRQDSVTDGDALLVEGREAYAKGDYQTASGKYRQALEKLPDAPMVADRRQSYNEHLSDASVALAMQNRKVGKYAEASKLLEDAIASDPGNEDAKRELGVLDDPIRTNSALTDEHAQNVDQVRRGLYTAEGNFNLGKYDDAKKSYEDILKTDPYNQAARRGLERVASAKSDYYRAAYDHTRAELLAEVDEAWELAVPKYENSKIEVDKEFRNPTEFEPLELVDKDEDVSKRKLAEVEENLSKQPKVNLAELMEEIAASENPYSTFSLNISDASFQLAKAALAKGERPDPEGIKVEQFYNAVDYGDSSPSSDQPVAATIEQSAHPVIPGRELVRVALRTASVGRAASQPLMLTLLVDQSGSMVREDRRAAMENALKQLGGLLTKNDHITVIGFSRTPHLLAEGLTGDQGAKLGDIINQTASEGGTNLEEAIKLAAQKAGETQLAGAQNRIVLFTDGAANLGNANSDTLAKLVAALRQKGIAFDIAGIGAGQNDRLLGELARHGNGRYYVVGDEKNDSFARQLAGAFRPAAENVKVQVNFNPQRVGKYKLIGFEKDRLKTEDFRNDSVDAAELAADEAGVALYQVEPLAGGTGEIGEVSVRFRDVASGEMVERTWTIPYESSATAFDRATPSMQLAGLSLLAAEKLKGGPMADAIDFKDLAAPLADVKLFYAASPRVGDMLRVIDALK